MELPLLEGHPFTPSAIFCIGRNYAQHARELGNAIPEAPVVFIKPAGCLSSRVLLPKDEEVRYEAEICFVLHQGAIIGAGFCLDMTKPRVQESLKAKGLPWEKSKAFPHAAVLSPCVRIDTFAGLRLAFYLEGNLVQQGSVEEMLFAPELLIADLKAHFPLGAYDLLMSGTPQGVGTMRPGSHYRGELWQGERLLAVLEGESGIAEPCGNLSASISGL